LTKEKIWCFISTSLGTDARPRKKTGTATLKNGKKDMKTHTIKLPAMLARKIIRRNAGPIFSDSSKAAHDSAIRFAEGPAENLPRGLSARRGMRRAGTMIPGNMASKMADSESAAWSHSVACGVLWESGIRLGTARAWAEEFFPATQKMFDASSQQ
jgi:hypothetical protein